MKIVEPAEFSFLNFDLTTALEGEFMRTELTKDMIFAYNFDLSIEI